MFAAIARFDIRFRWLIIAVWLVGVGAGGRMLPGLASVTHASNGQFLPTSSPSVQATRLAAPFQVVDPNQTATIVASGAARPLAASDATAMSQVEQAVRQVPGVASVRDAGTSPDGRATQAVVTVPGPVSSSNTSATDTVHRIRAAIAHAGAPPGLDLHLTGAQLAGDPVFRTVGSPVLIPDGRTVLYSAVLRWRWARTTTSWS